MALRQSAFPEVMAAYQSGERTARESISASVSTKRSIPVRKLVWQIGGDAVPRHAVVGVDHDA
jgi:hypothetical protein